MKKMNLKHLSYVAVLAAPFLFASCDEETSFSTPVVNWNMPADTTITVNDSLQFAPGVLSNGSAMTYLWIVDGEEVATTKDYTFRPSAAKSYQITFYATNSGGMIQKTMKVDVRMFAGGFYMINEGSFGKQQASFNYYSNGSWAYPTYNDFVTALPDCYLGATGSTGLLHGNSFYIVSKEAPVLSRLDASTLRIEKSIATREEINNGQGASFCIVDDQNAIFTTSKGAYVVDPTSLTLKSTLSEGRTTDVIKHGDYVYLLANDSVQIYKADDLSLVAANQAKAYTGFAVTGNTVWAGNKTELVKIDGTSVSTVALPDDLSVAYNQWAYTPTSLCASLDGKYLYFVQPEGFSNTKAYKYDVASQQATMLLESTDGYTFYGASMQVNPNSGDLYLIYNKNYSDQNRIIVTSSEGTPKDTLDYSGEYWFPSTLVFE